MDTWNIKSIKGKEEEEVVDEMEKYGMEILGTLETIKKRRKP